jgi:hypothetical protein
MMVYHEPRAVNIGQIDAGREELVGGAHPKKEILKKGLACCLECPPLPRHFNGGINNRFHARAHCPIGIPIPGRIAEVVPMLNNITAVVHYYATRDRGH